MEFLGFPPICSPFTQLNDQHCPLSTYFKHHSSWQELRCRQIWDGNEGLTEMDMGKNKSITQEVIWRGGGEWGTGTVSTGYAVSNSEPVSAFQEWCGFGGRRNEPVG